MDCGVVMVWYGISFMILTLLSSSFPFLSLVQHVRPLCMRRTLDVVFATLFGQRPFCLKSQAAHGQPAQQHPTTIVQTTERSEVRSELTDVAVVLTDFALEHTPGGGLGLRCELAAAITSGVGSNAHLAYTLVKLDSLISAIESSANEVVVLDVEHAGRWGADSTGCGRPAGGWPQTARLLRPLRRRWDRMARPARVRMRRRNPCTL